jgi:hypothetical protein
MRIFQLALTVILVSSATVASAQSVQNSEKSQEKLVTKEVIARPVANPTELKSVTKTNIEAEKVSPQKINATSRKVEALVPEKK